MDIGIIGAGSIGGTLARLWAEAGHKVMISSRHPEELKSLAEDIGGNADYGTVKEAAAFGEVVVLAIPLKGRGDTVPDIKSSLNGKVVIDAMNPFPGRDGSIAEGIIKKGIASGVATSEQLDQSEVVRAFSSVYFKELQSESHREGEKVAIPMAAETEKARDIAAGLIRDAGFEPYDLGSLAESKPLDPDGQLFGSTLTAQEIRAMFEDQ
ncbi:MAG: NAD(P)-binding domain-containing protein [Balneolaceae bacterium]|nr:NAD(P)-binding domain-containing protein [Balneolaceae bacterium]